MRYGNCVSYKDLDKIKVLKAVGFDYIETGLSALYGANLEEVRAFTQAIAENEISCEAVNVFFPGEVILVGELVDFAAVREYVDEVCEKTKHIGFKTAVFGSGRARNCPEGFQRERAVEQLVTLTREILRPAAEKYNFTIAVEPLNTDETNTINILREAEYIAERADSENIKVLADLYHMTKESDTLTNLDNLNLLAHCHISEPITRKYPHASDPAKHIEICRQFFADLHDRGYDGRMSIEAGLAGITPPDAYAIPDDIDVMYREFYYEAASTLEFLKSLKCD